MPSQQWTHADEKPSASLQLRTITNEAADLIKNALADLEAPKKWAFLVRSSLRAYGVGRVSFIVDEAGSDERRGIHLRRLVARDFTRSRLGNPPRRVAVIDNSAFHVDDLTVQIRAGATVSFPQELFHPRTAHLIRFWIDVQHELGDELAGLFKTGEEHNRLRALSDRAAMAAAASVRERRLALRMSPVRFAHHLDIPPEDVAGIEKGEITTTSSLLDQIEAAFVKEREYLGLGDFVLAETEVSNNARVQGARLRRVTIEKSRSTAQQGQRRRKAQRDQPATTPGERVRKRRRKARINQVTLAKQVGISVDDLSDLERDRVVIDSGMQRQLNAAISHIEATRPSILM